jgi:hypothetical protein
MQSCAICAQTDDLRLYEVLGGRQDDRRWLCLECMFLLRRLGVNAEPVPAWIERAALHQLPLKPLEPARSEADIAGSSPSRLARLRALEGDALALDEPVRPVDADVAS